MVSKTALRLSCDVLLREMASGQRARVGLTGLHISIVEGCDVLDCKAEHVVICAALPEAWQSNSVTCLI